jgi:PRTRC genetic system protein A
MSMDMAIAASFPLIAATHDQPVAPAAGNGMRYIAGQTGLWREVKLPWVLLRHKIAESQFPLPYASVHSVVEFTCGPLPAHLVREFVAEAREASPQEMAGVFLWHEGTDSWRYERREGKRVQTDYISYTEVRAREGEHIVVDVHSHGRHPAFFSEQDNEDDRGSMKVSLVLGNLDCPTPSSQMRLCIAGHIINNARIDSNGQLGVA